MSDQYVVLTGARSNAGDHLIKRRTDELLAAVRPDRRLVHYDAWKPFTAEHLAVVNASRALLLAGGPALQPRMHPNVYPLVPDLARIRVPVILMGIGWKSLEGSWEATADYPLSVETVALLRRVDASGYLSSVRDYRTLGVLFKHGFENVIVTGCPALFTPERPPKPARALSEIANISFSLGVSFVTNKAMEENMKEALLRIVEDFPGSKIAAVFHHSPSMTLPPSPTKDLKRFVAKHQEIATWLSREGVGTAEVAGSADLMINHYRNCDLHVGYRVHAHILMSSWSKPTLLVTEDGRGKALKEVIGGVAVDGYSYERPSPAMGARALRRLGLLADRSYRANPRLSENLISQLRYELREGCPHASLTRGSIDLHYEFMMRFLKQLP